jgi:hypothetical protein
VYWTQHAQGLAPKVRKQAMKRVYEIEKAIEQRSKVENDTDSAATYFSGETIKIGDAVRIGAEDGIVEMVITKDSPEVNYFPEGVMVTGAAFGRKHAKFGEKDLLFICRNK